MQILAPVQRSYRGHLGSGSHVGQRPGHPQLHQRRDPSPVQVRMKSEFPPQSVPFYAATQNFLKLREQHPQYAYKGATLNPS